MNKRLRYFLPAAVVKKFDESELFRRVLNNASWLAGDNVIRLLVTVIVSAWVARHLGPAQFGMLGYAIALSAMFIPFANFGADSIVVRDLALNQESERTVLGTVVVLRVAGACFAVAACLCTAFFLNAGDERRLVIIALVSIATLFTPAQALDLWFQARLRSRAPVSARQLAFLTGAAVRLGCIFLDASLEVFAALVIAEAAMSAVLVVIVFSRTAERPRLNPAIAFARRFLKESLPLLGAAIVVGIYMRIDQIMLGEMLGDEALGVYVAAVRVSEGWYFLPTAIAASVAPTLAAVRWNEPLYKARMEKFFRLMALLAYSVAFFVFVLSDVIISVLYGDAYADAAAVLRLHSCAYLFVALGVASSQYLIIEKLSIVLFERTLAGAIVNVVLNLILIPRFGILGAAWATFISYGVAVLFLFHRPASRRCLGMMLRAALPFPTARHSL